MSRDWVSLSLVAAGRSPPVREGHGTPVHPATVLRLRVTTTLLAADPLGIGLDLGSPHPARRRSPRSTGTWARRTTPLLRYLPPRGLLGLGPLDGHKFTEAPTSHREWCTQLQRVRPEKLVPRLSSNPRRWEPTHRWLVGAPDQGMPSRGQPAPQTPQCPSAQQG